MKVKNNFILREVSNQYIVVPVGKTATEFNGIINLNETGAFLWQQLKDEISFDSLKINFMNKYEIDEKTALRDMEIFLKKLQEEGLLE